MHHDDSPARGNSPAKEDEMAEVAVLMCVLDAHPAQLTGTEIAREVTLDSDCFRDQDLVNRAIQRLAGVGLVRRHGEAVVATRAAQYVKTLDLP